MTTIPRYGHIATVLLCYCLQQVIVVVVIPAPCELVPYVYSGDKVHGQSILVSGLEGVSLRCSCRALQVPLPERVAVDLERCKACLLFVSAPDRIKLVSDPFELSDCSGMSEVQPSAREKLQFHMCDRHLLSPWFCYNRTGPALYLFRAHRRSPLTLSRAQSEASLYKVKGSSHLGGSRIVREART